nr:uncharacterized protein LOC112489836 [Ziziphus jujuba var. spinosa]
MKKSQSKRRKKGKEKEKETTTTSWRQLSISEMVDSSPLKRRKRGNEEETRSDSEPSVSGWSSLRSGLLEEIVERLGNRRDILNLRAVCSAWRSSIPIPLSNFGIGSPLEIYIPSGVTKPCLNGEQHYDEFRGYFYVKEDTIYCFEPMIKNSITTRANTNWFVKIEEVEPGKVRIKDLLSRSTSKNSENVVDSLPNVLNLLDYRIKEVGKEYYLEFVRSKENGLVIKPVDEVIKKVVLGQTERGEFAVMILYFSGKVRLVILGVERWLRIESYEYDEFFEDIAYFDKGVFYAVDRSGMTVKVDSSLMDIEEFAPSPLVPSHRKYSSSSTRYLVKSLGNLFMVNTYMSDDEAEFPTLDVFKFDEELAQWDLVPDLGDRALFLGDGCSFSVSCREFVGCEENCIYLRNDCFRRAKVGDYPGCDTGIFDLKMFRAAKLGNLHSGMFWPPPNWLKQIPISEFTKKHKGRGPTRFPDLRKGFAKSKDIVYNDYGVPINEMGKKMTMFEGICARVLVPISYRNWNSVPEDMKQKLWETIQQYFDKDESLRKRTLQNCGNKWRKFKSKLYTQYVYPYLKTPEVFENPPGKYVFITQEAWNEFLGQRLDPEFLELHKQRSELAKRNKYPHRISIGGYAMLERRMQEERGTNEPIPREDLWIEARKDKEGNFTNEDVVRVVQSIKELSEMQEQGQLVSQGKEDILSKALGTLEYGARVRGKGKFVTPTSFFHLPRRASRSTVRDTARDEEISSLRESTKQLQQQIAILTSVLTKSGVLREVLSNQLLNNTCGSNPEDLKTPPAVGSNSDVNMTTDHATNLVTPIAAPVYPSSTPQSQGINCRLAQGTIDNVVAHGILWSSSDPQALCHGVQLGSNVRVTVLEALNPLAPLPVSSFDITTVGEALGSFCAWPRHLVVLPEDEQNVHNTNDKDKSPIPDSNNTLRSHKSQTSVKSIMNQDYKSMPTAVRLLKILSDNLPNDTLYKIAMGLQILGNDTPAYLSKDDINAFCTMDEISADCILLYIRHLHETLRTENKDGMFAFLDPRSIMNHTSKSGEDRAVEIARRWKKTLTHQIWLLPYCQFDHWMLGVVDPQMGHAWFFDSFKSGVQLDFKQVVNRAFAIWNANQAKCYRAKLFWQTTKIPKQSSSFESGYYVCMMMRDIIKVPTPQALPNMFDDAVWDQLHIDTFRTQWAAYMTDVIDNPASSE